MVKAIAETAKKKGSVVKKDNRKKNTGKDKNFAVIPCDGYP
ncbi:MAG: hypothetical protein WC428_04715 [Candidatus Paceibacterota bacterium]|jgi:hypothetical protein